MIAWLVACSSPEPASHDSSLDPGQPVYSVPEQGPGTAETFHGIPRADLAGCVCSWYYDDQADPWDEVFDENGYVERTVTWNDGKVERESLYETRLDELGRPVLELRGGEDTWSHYAYDGDSWMQVLEWWGVEDAEPDEWAITWTWDEEFIYEHDPAVVGDQRVATRGDGVRIQRWEWEQGWIIDLDWVGNRVVTMRHGYEDDHSLTELNYDEHGRFTEWYDGYTGELFYRFEWDCP